ncbi:hypothetical protein DL95DRAFT_518819 [Leptodontidium sp. 2 PMI_412]|nr:putative integral membrane protein [Leptodontidium sp. MPI-SDFR-AT-0119]KAH9222050.1 hypothetical protein DL95DRAFT_518819 [Leptodontidium sp. 2 PMI_412]
MAEVRVPGDRSLSVRAVAGTFGVLAWISVGLRCYVRLKFVKSFGWDDGLMVLALAFYTVLTVCMVTASFYGTGQHEANLTAEHIVIAKRLWWLCEVAYGFTSMALKASICIFLLRITVKKLHRWILYSVMAVTLLTGLVLSLVLLLQCRPLPYFWDKSLHGTCIDWQVIIAMSWLYSICAGTCDFTVGLLPIFLVRNLQMKTRTKVLVAGILGIACIASSATIIRLPFLHTFADSDWLWATTDIALWTDIEVGLGIFASCLATLRPLLRILRNRPPLKSSDANQHSDNHNRSGGNTFRRIEEGGGQKFRPQNMGITMTTIHTNAGGYDGNGSDDHLNKSQPPLPGDENPKQNYIVQKSFYITSESLPLEHV